MLSPVRHAAHALLWSSVVIDPTNPDGAYLEADRYELAPDSLSRLAAEWEQFTDALEPTGFDPADALAVALHPDNEGDPWHAVAHDWILTRNHHGAGFWDGGWHAPWSELLTQLSHALPELELYLGDDGLVHIY